MNKPITIAVDFDGTLCDNAFPEIGLPKKQTISWLLKKQKDNNVKLILWTCREGEFLDKAVEWCKKYELYFDAINENLPELKFKDFANRKICADIYLDDRALNVEDII